MKKFSYWTRLGILIGLLLAGWTVLGLAVFGAVQVAKIAGWLA